jgi:hypothetical protein
MASVANHTRKGAIAMDMLTFFARNPVKLFSSSRHSRRPDQVGRLWASDDLSCRLAQGSSLLAPQPHHYTLNLAYQGRIIKVFFTIGAHCNRAACQHRPSVMEVLDSLALDAEGCENSESFETWCSDFGYVADDANARIVYEGCKESARKLRFLLGDAAAHTLIFDVERL